MSSQTKSLNAEVWSLSWPMILANLSIPLFGLVDTAILGHLPDSRYLSAVAIGSSLLSLCYWAFGFLRMGTTGASAQSHHEDSSALLAKALGAGILLGCLIFLAGPALRSVGLSLMNTSDTLQPIASDYLYWRLYGAPAVLCSYAITGWLLGQRQARWPLLIAVCGNCANILLDLLFIIGLEMNSTGAAIASTISEYLALILGLWATRKPLSQAIRRGLKQSLQQGPTIRRFAKNNFEIFVRTASLLFSLSFFTAQGASQGATTLAANAILMQLVMAAAYGMDGFAHAAEALAGRAFADSDRQRFIAVCRCCGRWALYSAIAASLLLLVAETPLLDTMTDLPDVRSAASEYYNWLIILPLASAACYCYDGIFIGALRTKALQYCMLVSVFGLYLPIWYTSQSWGNHGLWFAFTCLNIARGVTLALCFVWIFSPPRWQNTLR